MSHSTNAVTNKHPNHPKVQFEQYLSNYAEPKDDRSHDLPPQLEAELLDNSFTTKQRIKRKAQHIRKLYF